MTGPAPELDLSLAPEGLPSELLPLWSRAVAALTESELVAVVLRFGFRTGKPAPFGAIARELGVNRVRAQAIFTNALSRLGRLEETRALSRYLADLNAVLNEGAEREPAKIERRPVPSFEDPFAAPPLRSQDPRFEAHFDEPWVPPFVEPAPAFDRIAPVSRSPIAEFVAPNDVIEPAVAPAVAPAVEPAIETEEPVSEREAFSLVRAADRELARAIESCAGREDLVAALQRARNRIAAGMREIEQAAPAPAASTPSRPATDLASTPVSERGVERRGRPANVEENARRAAVLARVHAGALTNAEAASELGLSYGAWSGWKAYHQKRTGAIAPAASVRASAATSPRGTAKHGAGRSVDADADAARATSELEFQELVARQQSFERFGVELRERVREMMAMAERWFPE